MAVGCASASNETAVESELALRDSAFDSSFSDHGVALVDGVDASLDRPRLVGDDGGAVAVLSHRWQRSPDGAARPQYVLTRLDASGVADHAFGREGEIEGEPGLLAGAIVKTDERFLVASVAREIARDRGRIVVDAYASSGQRDLMFGHEGRLVISTGGWGERASVRAMIAMPTNEIVIIGDRRRAIEHDPDRAGTGDRQEVFALKLRPGGWVDEEFGDGGIAVVRDGASNGVRAAALTTGEILLVGRAEEETREFRPYGYAAKIDGNGRVVESFGERGAVRPAFLFESIDAVSPGPAGTWLVTGASAPQLRSMVVARLSADGKLDTSFNSPHGYRAQLVHGASANGAAVAVDARGRVTVAGAVQREGVDGMSESAAFWRLGHDGSQDDAFGDAGRVELGSLGQARVRELQLGDARRPIALGTRWQDGAFSLFVAKLGE